MTLGLLFLAGFALADTRAKHSDDRHLRLRFLET